MRIAFVTTCKGRLEHLRQTLPKNIKNNQRGDSVFVVLSYNDQEGLDEYIRQEHQADLDSGKLVYYRNRQASKFRMAHAKNQAMRCAMLEGADILVMLDADNFTGREFGDYVDFKFESGPDLSFICPDFKTLPARNDRANVNNPMWLKRGFAGRLAIRVQDFVKVGGYDETFDTWRGEDIDIISRLDRLGLKKGFIDTVYLSAIAHSTRVRFREYPEARKHESEDMYIIAEKNHNTVVNYGSWGTGVVVRHCGAEVHLSPLPTRVFGIGMQRTGTTSLHETFRMMGFDSAHWKSATWAKSIWDEMARWRHSRTLEKDYAICDNPIPMLYEHLDRAYPGSRFILTVRDENAWLESVERLWTYGGNPHRRSWDDDGFTHRMHAVIYGTSFPSRQEFLDRYRRHNAGVEQYFRGRNDFMKLDVDKDTSMAKLCMFLSQSPMDIQFPHSNRGTLQ